MQTTIKTKIDLATIIMVAEEMMFNFDGTTTLEVKTELRNRGYWATQSEVSTLMQQAQNQQDWDFTEKQNGMGITYRVYTLKDNNAIPASITAAKSAPSTPGVNVNGYIKRDGTVVSPIDSKDAKMADWCVSSVITAGTMYFPSKFTRDEVRYAFGALTGTSKNTTRANRVK